VPVARKDDDDEVYRGSAAKFAAIVADRVDCRRRGQPVLVGTASIEKSEVLSRLLSDKKTFREVLGHLYPATKEPAPENKKDKGGFVRKHTLSEILAELPVPHEVLNARHHEREARIVAEAGVPGAITVATNMAGRGTDIHLGRGVAENGGLHVIATEPHGSGRVDRQLFGRAARQGDPGVAQMFASADDDLLKRHADKLRKRWRAIGPERLIGIAQARAEKLARFHRKQVLRSDDWMDQSLPF